MLALVYLITAWDPGEKKKKGKAKGKSNPKYSHSPIVVSTLHILSQKNW